MEMGLQMRWSCLFKNLFTINSHYLILNGSQTLFCIYTLFSMLMNTMLAARLFALFTLFSLHEQPLAFAYYFACFDYFAFI